MAGVACAGAITFAWLTVSPAAPKAEIHEGPTETAIFSGGCFWGLQAAFDELPGVVRTRTGYTGGALPNPTYTRVITGDSGHVEAVEVVFDPARVSYAEVVRHFFAHHRVPLGEQTEGYATKHYRSAVFYSTAEQHQQAGEVIAALNQSGRFAQPVATLLEPAVVFWEAEAEHQNYLAQCVH